MRSCRDGRSPARSPRLLPPIVCSGSDSLSVHSWDSKAVSGEDRPWSKYHSDCVVSPGRYCHSKNKDKTRKSEDRVKKFLKKQPQFLEDFVLENVTTEQLERWLLRKSRCQSASNNMKFRISMDNDQVEQLQNMVRMINTNASIEKMIYEIFCCVSAGMGCDDFNVYTVQDDVIKQLISANGETCANLVTAQGKLKSIVTEVSNTRKIRRMQPVNTNMTRKSSKHYLYLPITEEDQVFVIEMCRENTPFYLEDENLASTFSVWASLNIHCLEVIHDLWKKKDLQEFLSTVTESIFQDIGSIEALVEKIMHFAQVLVKADRASLFLVDSKTKELYATVFDVGVQDDVSNSAVNRKVARDEIRFPIGVGIAGYVAKTGETLNILDAYKDDRFNSTVDLKTGYRTKTILCMPVYSKNTIIGVVQMVNKMGDGFNVSDAEAFRVFAVYCGLALHNNKLYSKIKRSEQKYKVALEVLSYHNTCNDEEVNKAIKDLNEFNIKNNDFTFNPFVLTDYEKSLSTVQMFIDLFQLQDFDAMCLTRFALTVKKNYRRLPYHNWAHGYAVCNTIYTILMQQGNVFTRNERLALFIGTLCHDLDHRGKNNKFMLDSESPLAAMYSTSTMEHHHFNQTIIILQQDGHNIFAQLSNTDYKEVLGLLKHCILATDLAAFFPNKTKLQNLLKEKEFNWNNMEHRNLSLAITMTAADLSASAKPWYIQSETVKVIFEEFYDQGDAERAAGRMPIAMMDRDRPEEQPTSQVGFLKGICLPCYEILTQLIPKTKPLYDMCLDNLERWLAIEEKVRRYCDETRSIQEVIDFLENLILVSSSPNAGRPVFRIPRSISEELTSLNIEGDE